MKADAGRFFVLCESLKRGSFRATLDVPGRSKDVRTGQIELPDLITGRHEMGRRNPDDVIGSTNTLTLISDRVVQLIADAGFTGWWSKPCILDAKGGEKIRGINLLIVKGRCGLCDWSGIEKVSSDFIKGLSFDLDNWDRSDFFVPDDLHIIVITDRVRSLLQDQLVTGAEFTALGDYLAHSPAVH